MCIFFFVQIFICFITQRISKILNFSGPSPLYLYTSLSLTYLTRKFSRLKSVHMNVKYTTMLYYIIYITSNKLNDIIQNMTLSLFSTWTQTTCFSFLELKLLIHTRNIVEQIKPPVSSRLILILSREKDVNGYESTWICIGAGINVLKLFWAVLILSSLHVKYIC